MRTIRQLLVFPLVLVTAMAAPAFADVQHLVPPGQLTATVTDRVAAQDASRAAIREALARPEVRDVATSMHLDLVARGGRDRDARPARISIRRRTPRGRSISSWSAARRRS